MKKLIRIIQFIVFLRKNNAYGKLRRNYKRSRNRDKFWKYVSERILMTDDTYYSIFSGAFCWSSTPEEFDYWCVLNGVWFGKFKSN